MTTPPLVITYRSVTAVVTMLVLLSVGLGFAGYGPLVDLHRIAQPVSHELHLDRISG
ncbi:MAG: hypothetical protein ACRDNO_25315 [Trebonia sp.]